MMVLHGLPALSRFRLDRLESRLAERIGHPVSVAAATQLYFVDTARPLDEAEQLASEGKYDQAVHVLLLRSLRVLAESQGLPVSLTSREIVRDVTMPDDAREALAELVGEVETSLFGGRAVDAPSWARCRERYASFVAILRGANAGSRA